MDAPQAPADAHLSGGGIGVHLFYERAPWAMALLDGGQKLKHANPAFCQLLSLELNELVGRTLEEIFPQDAHCVAMLQRVLRTGQAESHLGNLASSEASPLWSYTLWPVSAGHLQTDVMLQVTETMQGHQAMVAVNEALVLASLRQQELASESEDRFQHIADAAPVLIWISDIQRQGIWFNKTWLGFTGRSLEEERGEGWSHEIHPEDLPGWLKAYHDSFETRCPYMREFRLRSHDGSYRWLLGNGIPRFASSGEFLGFIGSCLEITRQKQVEEALRANEDRMRLATEATGVGIWEWNLLTNHLYWDAEMFRIYGLTPVAGGKVPYSSWSAAVLNEELGAQEAMLRETILRLGHGTREFKIVRPDGCRRQIQAVETVRTNAMGQAEWVVGTNLDVTERRQVEEGLRDHAAALAQADRSKNEFLAMLAHELRNPLAPLRNSAEILQTPEATPEECQQAQRIIGRQLENMTRMIEDLLDVSRITEGKIELRKAAVSLEDVLTSATSMARSAIAAAHQTLDVALPEPPIFIHGDSTRLEQVFVNLLGNACKYAGDGSHIWLSVELPAPLAGHSPEVWIKVRDDGTGIDPDLLPRVFDLFVQATRSLDRSHGGLGIGLTLANRLVKLHGGSLEAHSAGLGQGAEFIVRLPILSQVPPKPPLPPQLAASSPKRILIVDDNKDSATSLSILQTRRGHITRTAFTGPDALSIAAEFAPDVILLDIGLPGMDGYEVARRLRTLPTVSKTLLVAMTGYATAEDREQATQAGFDKHLVKPVDLELLKIWLQSLP